VAAVRLMFGMEISQRKAQLVEEAARQAEARLVGVRLENRLALLRVARLFAEIERGRGSRSLVERMGDSGISARSARMMAAAGRAVESRPALEREVLTGAVTMDEAAVEDPLADTYGAADNRGTKEKEPPPGDP
jgi:hypothetical protein